MSYNGHVVVDSDCHLREYWELDRTYKETMDPEYREKYAWFSAAVRSRQAKPGDVGFTPLFWPRHPDRPLGLDEAFELADPALPQDRPDRPAPTVTGRGYDIDPTCNWDPSIRLRDMEAAGVDVSFIFPSQADGFCTLGDIGFESALHRSYHRFMSNYCADANGRLWWMGVLTMRDLPESIAQLEYWAKEDPHFAGVHLPRACPDGRMLDLLRDRLQEWTGERWMIALTEEGGEPTLAERDRAAQEAADKAAMDHPMVRQVLDAFPGARVRKVHRPAPDSGNDGDASP